jgi:hypothetical protein
MTRQEQKTDAARDRDACLRILLFESSCMISQTMVSRLLKRGASRSYCWSWDTPVDGANLVQRNKADKVSLSVGTVNTILLRNEFKGLFSKKISSFLLWIFVRG